MTQKQKVYLRLANGKIFTGYSFGKYGETDGEVVFTTGMTGYPESLTDPSYSGQILVFTYPLIGNYGIPRFQRDNSAKAVQDSFESGKIQVRAVIISNYSFDYSHFDAVQSLDKWLEDNDIPGMYGIDTRELTKVLRTTGVMLGKITTQPDDETFNVIDPNETYLAGEVGVKEPVVYSPKENDTKKKILLIDCGVKNNIIRNFLKRGAEVIRVPYDYNPLNSNFDFNGIFVSNGPGDPKMCRATIENLRSSFELNIPIFGICLGSQILGLSAGADTYKLKFGHRSQNQPCIEIGGHCYITSQNHGYAVDTKTLPDDWSEWFINNNDGTNEGVKHKTKPFFAVQFHPESSPGPNDTGWLFDKFLDLI
ncbi:MAG: glutamine-hydrolyzing carbamoyl-phosphate synthase small subunit [Chlorobi bacterium]|nr:glutamine-hydrolyzing carbamoyl-phosphate synthase small subunit [Chlorobiota bacterium]MCI0715231.1 glutamine-hydrolyzing carbamoyl-phosphate synthase small subunit [Chlorobiota bacterium]